MCGIACSNLTPYVWLSSPIVFSIAILVNSPAILDAEVGDFPLITEPTKDDAKTSPVPW